MHLQKRFIVLLTLPEQIEIEIEIQSLREKLDPKNASKILPHITLKRPFLTLVTIEAIEMALEKVVSSREKFEIKLEGLGQFTNPNKVIFVNIEKSQALVRLQKEISSSLENLVEELGIKYQFNPHLTIASNLTEERFNEIKEKLNGFEPNYDFLANSFHLFEFSEKGVWQPKREFKFSQ